jgi:hypothetical protein
MTFAPFSPPEFSKLGRPRSDTQNYRKEKGLPKRGSANGNEPFAVAFETIKKRI